MTLVIVIMIIAWILDDKNAEKINCGVHTLFLISVLLIAALSPMIFVLSLLMSIESKSNWLFGTVTVIDAIILIMFIIYKVDNKSTKTSVEDTNKNIPKDCIELKQMVIQSDNSYEYNSLLLSHLAHCLNLLMVEAKKLEKECILIKIDKLINLLVSDSKMLLMTDKGEVLQNICNMGYRGSNPLKKFVNDRLEAFYVLCDECEIWRDIQSGIRRYVQVSQYHDLYENKISIDFFLFGAKGGYESLLNELKSDDGIETWKDFMQVYCMMVDKYLTDYQTYPDGNDEISKEIDKHILNEQRYLYQDKFCVENLWNGNEEL